MPTKISFTDGSTVKYSYSADGEKLSVDYDLMLMNVINGTSNSTQAGGGVKLHRDYCGDFIYEDGALKTMLFDGGYAVNAVDINRKDSYYANDGKYLFDNLKETDFIYIVSGYNVIRQLSNGTELVELFGKQSFMDARLSAEAYSNIFTDVLKRNYFDVQSLENGKISVYVMSSNTKRDGPQYQDESSYNNPKMFKWSDSDLAVTRTINNKNNITAYVVWCDGNMLNYFSTISNIVSVLGVHELTGHGLMHIDSEQHWKILQMQREHPSWNKTTEKFKELYIYLENHNRNEYIKQ